MSEERRKQFYLFGIGEEGASVEVVVKITEMGAINAPHFNIRSKREKQTVKGKMRSLDKTWVFHNIPSSIWWHTEIHHNWEDGARMYLLTPKEHLKRTREEIKQR